jgi:hypothetical protein
MQRGNRRLPAFFSEDDYRGFSRGSKSRSRAASRPAARAGQARGHEKIGTVSPMAVK